MFFVLLKWRNVPGAPASLAQKKQHSPILAFETWAVSYSMMAVVRNVGMMPYGRFMVSGKKVFGIKPNMNFPRPSDRLNTR